VRLSSGSLRACRRGGSSTSAAGTGFLTRHLRGNVVGVDQSAEVLELARARLPGAELVCAEVPPLPFADGAFDLAFSSNVYSHLDAAAARAELVAEALRVAGALVVLEQSWRPGREREAWELRRLLDGSEHRVFKRYLTADELARELEAVVVLASAEFAAVRIPLSSERQPRDGTSRVSGAEVGSARSLLAQGRERGVRIRSR
jgi:SAM-dependent methyltransferase